MIRVTRILITIDHLQSKYCCIMLTWRPRENQLSEYVVWPAGPKWVRSVNSAVDSRERNHTGIGVWRDQKSQLVGL